MRRIALAAVVVGVFTVSMAFTLHFTPAPREVISHRAMPSDIQMATAHTQSPVHATPSGGVVELASARVVDHPQPQGFSDWFRKIRRFLQAIRDAIDSILDHTSDGNGGPGGTIVGGGIQKG